MKGPIKHCGHPFNTKWRPEFLTSTVICCFFLQAIFALLINKGAATYSGRVEDNWQWKCYLTDLYLANDRQFFVKVGICSTELSTVVFFLFMHTVLSTLHTGRYSRFHLPVAESRTYTEYGIQHGTLTTKAFLNTNVQQLMGLEL
jgi:hypothetical protein